MVNALGRHILVEFLGCSAEVLDDVSVIERAMLTAAQKAGATIINSTFHHFSPYGVSGVVVIQESHLAIHTWPEYQYAAVDLFTCGDAVDGWVSFDHLRQSFHAQNQSALEMHRGSLSLLNRVPVNLVEGRAHASGELHPEIKRNLWFTDRDNDRAMSLRYSGDPLFHEKSPHQTVTVYDTCAYGRMLAMDNMVMCTERDEFHYHEMMVHPALQLHGQPRHVLIIGGGDGGVAREVLRYPSIEKVTLVEIDETVTRAARQHLPSTAAALSNRALELRFEDGIRYVAQSPSSSFDVVIVDTSDPQGPIRGVFNQEFHGHCHRVLRPDGLFVTQAESPMFRQQTFVEIAQCLRSLYGAERVHTMLVFVPTYPTGMWALQLATRRDMDPVAALDVPAARAFSRSHGLRYYNESIHGAAFQLPGFVRQLLSTSGANLSQPDTRQRSLQTTP